MATYHANAMRALQAKALIATDADGKKYQWRFWRSPLANRWMLQDHEDYSRVLEESWAASVPRIKAILENYGMKANVS